MKRYSLLLFLVINQFFLFSQGGPSNTETRAEGKNTISKTSPLFIENKGQIIDQFEAPNPDVNFLLNSPGFNVQLRKTGFSYDVYHIDKPISLSERKTPKDTAYQDRFTADTNRSLISYHRIDINFEGINAEFEIIPEEPDSYYLNYYSATTPESGITGVHQYRKVTYRNIYPGIDLEFLAGGVEPFKYNFIIDPGATIENIRFTIDGASDIKEEDGCLLFSTSMNAIQEKIPLSFFLQKNTRTDIEVAFRKIQGNTFGFFTPKEIPSDAILVIDPLPDIVWGTYYGGYDYDLLFDCSVDASGNVYSVGYTGSANYIATSGAYQTTLSGSYDAFLVKFNSSGVRQWGTYYGGYNNDYGFDISVSDSGIYIIGSTYSTNNIATGGAYQTVLNGSADAFLVKFNSSGLRQWGTYYGGGEYEQGVSVHCYNNGVIYFTGFTQSATGIATTEAYQTSLNAWQDAFLVKFDSSGARQWGTYYGGDSEDTGMDVSTDENGNIYFVGRTYSYNGIATPEAHQSSLGGYSDAFLAKFNSSGLRQWGTYYGGSSSESGNGVSIDNSGNVYLTGDTESTTGIATSGAHQLSLGGYSDAFLVKFNPSGTRQWGTYYGGNDYDIGESVVADDNGDIYITGYTYSTNGISTVGSYQPDKAGGQDVFLANLNSTGVRQWGTYYGGNDYDIGESVVADDNGDIYITGYTLSSDGIATPGAHQSSLGGSYDAFLAKFTSCFSTNIISHPSDIAKCVGITADFQVTVTGDGLTYQWQVDKGSGFINLSNDSLYNGVLTNHLFVSNPDTNLDGYIYRCVLTNRCLTAVNSNSATLTINPLPTPTISPQPLYVESFENGGSIPPGWETQTIVPNNTITFPTASSHPAGYSAYNGTRLVRFNSYDYGNGVVHLKTIVPVSTIGSLNVTVEFAWLVSSAYPTSNDRVELEWSLDDSIWISAGTFPRHDTVNGWTVKTQQLPLSAGEQPTLYIAFKFTSEFGNDCYLDLAKVYLNTSSVCVGSSTSYATESGNTAYGWTVSSGGTITSGSDTSAITILWSTPGPKTIGVNYTNSNGCKANDPVTTITVVDSLPVPTIAGSTTVCTGSSGHIYTTEEDMIGYQWSVSNGGTITAGGSDSLNTVTVTWDSTGAQTVSVGYTNSNGCTTNPLTSFDVTVYPLPVPTITGETSACANSGNYTYSTETEMTGYVWTISPSGQIISGQGSYQVAVNWLAAGAQWVGVSYTNGNDCTAAAASTLTVTVDGVPGQMGAITGIYSICGVAVNIFYTANPIANANAYNWTVPPGAIITSGAGTTSILVYYPATALSGNVTVTASNACGNGAPSPPLEITVTQIPATPEIHLQGNMLFSNTLTGNQWFKNGIKITGATGSTHLVVEEGEYWDKVTINSCESDTSNHIYVIITGIEEHQSEGITLYPNPNIGTFTLRFDQKMDESYEIVVVNQIGMKVTEKQLLVKQGNTDHQIDLRPLPIGVYTILISGETTRVVKKIIVN